MSADGAGPAGAAAAGRARTTSVRPAYRDRMSPHRAPAAAGRHHRPGGPRLDLDWDLALGLARAATPAGPRATAAERTSLVSLLHEAAALAPQRVGRLTGLGAVARAVQESAQVRVVDRDGARRGVVDALCRVLDATTREGGRTREDDAEGGVGAVLPVGATSPGRRAARRLAAAEVAAALGAVSTRLLGEVIPAAPGAGSAEGASRDGAAPGPRLLLVAPNVLALARREDLDLADLARWVALHETVHAVQLAAAPWLAAHLASCVADVVRAVAARDAAAVRDRVAALSAVLALLEGHAEAALDGVAPEEIGSVHRLRAVVGPARAGALADALARLTGVRAKGTQHADGAAFVRTVLADAGPEGLAAAWAAPENLPRPDEVAAPAAWEERVLAADR